MLEFTIVRVDPSGVNPNGVAIDGMVSRQALASDKFGLTVMPRAPYLIAALLLTPAPAFGQSARFSHRLSLRR